MKGSSLPYIIVILALIGAIIYLIGTSSIGGPIISNLSQGITTAQIATTIFAYGNATNSVTTIGQANISGNSTQLEYYALSLINQDRQKYGLQNVTLSSEPSAQQHSSSMLYYNYFSHWDTYGMKPYMRYTLLGGTGGVSENIAYQSSSKCSLLGCIGTIDPQSALNAMEYSMMYNDSACCNNGHRDNILNPYHNQVSIGIAYNASKIYFSEDFINDYINWSNSPGFASGLVYLHGTLLDGYKIAQIEVSYDPQVQNMSIAQLDNTSDYGYGNAVAGVVSNPYSYFPGLDTIVANQYTTSKNNFMISFNIGNLTRKYGAGEYTAEVWLEAPNQSTFLGNTYTVFINQSEQAYVPGNV